MKSILVTFNGGDENSFKPVASPLNFKIITKTSGNGAYGSSALGQFVFYDGEDRLYVKKFYEVENTRSIFLLSTEPNEAALDLSAEYYVDLTDYEPQDGEYLITAEMSGVFNNTWHSRGLMEDTVFYCLDGGSYGYHSVMGIPHLDNTYTFTSDNIKVSKVQFLNYDPENPARYSHTFDVYKDNTLIGQVINGSNSQFEYDL